MDRTMLLDFLQCTVRRVCSILIGMSLWLVGNMHIPSLALLLLRRWIDFVVLVVTQSTLLPDGG
jgi:hypothetical protein